MFQKIECLNVNSSVCHVWFHLLHWKSNIEILSNNVLIPIVQEKELKIKSFVMGFHEYRTIWTPYKKELLLIRIEPTNKKDKFAIAVIGDKDSVVGHLMKRKGRRSAKTIFYFLRASEYHGCRVHVTGQAINQGDDKGMKVPCTLMFKGQSESVDILSQELKKHL